MSESNPVPNVYFVRYGSSPTVHRGGGVRGRGTPLCRNEGAPSGRYHSTDRPVTCKRCLRLP
jgi:hypothetical protein